MITQQLGLARALGAEGINNNNNNNNNNNDCD
jgi:hypothetical protein